MTIRQLTHSLNKAEQKQICKAMALLHTEAFQGFFLTSMGLSFLQLLYRGFIVQPDGISMVAEENGVIIGFAVGTNDPDCFFRNLLKKHGFKFAFAAIPGLLRNPIFVAKKCIGALFYRGETPAEIPNAALLSSLAVSPNESRKGVGQQLIKAFCDEAGKRGAEAVYLTTDESGNDDVNQFYSKCGFKLTDTLERQGNRVMNRWALTL